MGHLVPHHHAEPPPTTTTTPPTTNSELPNKDRSLYAERAGCTIRVKCSSTRVAQNVSNFFDYLSDSVDRTFSEETPTDASTTLYDHDTGDDSGTAGGRGRVRTPLGRRGAAPILRPAVGSHRDGK